MKVGKKSLTFENIGNPFVRKPQLKRTDEQVYIANYSGYYKKGYSPKERDYSTMDGTMVYKRR